jgi:DNA-binding SARP family transcriptional activator
MGKLKICLFHKLSMEANGRVIPKLEPRKAEELLGYLLVHRNVPHTREHLTDILWKGEIASEQSKGYLRKALWQLQSLLEQFSVQDILIIDGEWLQINQHFRYWLDIAVFEDAFRSIQGIKGSDLDKKQIQDIQFAAACYRGDLLEGWYQDWCTYERERFQHFYLSMLDKLMDYCEANQKYEEGLIYGEMILRYDHARESTHRRLMNLYYLFGDRTAALRQYERCISALREELDVEPAESTHSLKELIAKDQFKNEPRSTGTDDYKTDSLHRLFQRLIVVQKDLGNIQSELARNIRVIQKELKEKQV